jgi:hypothetical protein
MDALGRDWPDLVPLYEELYAKGAYLRGPEAKEVRRRVDELRRRYEVADRRTVRLEPDPEPEQLALAI